MLGLAERCSSLIKHLHMHLENSCSLINQTPRFITFCYKDLIMFGLFLPVLAVIFAVSYSLCAVFLCKIERTAMLKEFASPRD